MINFFFFVAEEVREIMAELGVRKFEDLIGRADRLDMRRGIEHFKAHGIDLTRLLARPEVGPNVAIRHTMEQEHDVGDVLDHTLIREASSRR